jgi:hypothetical protein
MAIKGSKLPISTLSWGVSEEGNDEVGEEAVDVVDPDFAPEETCSPLAGETVVTANEAATDGDVSAEEVAACAVEQAKENGVKSSENLPVHSRLPAEDSPLDLAGIFDRPRKEDVPMTAKERKRREKLAKQKLKQARQLQACGG